VARGIAGVESRSGPSNGGDLRPRNRGAVMWHSGLFRRTLTRRFAPACRTDSRWFGGRQKPPTDGGPDPEPDDSGVWVAALSQRSSCHQRKEGRVQRQAPSRFTVVRRRAHAEAEDGCKLQRSDAVKEQ
jgi:hypothetical protein